MLTLPFDKGVHCRLTHSFLLKLFLQFLFIFRQNANNGSNKKQNKTENQSHNKEWHKYNDLVAQKHITVGLPHSPQTAYQIIHT